CLFLAGEGPLTISIEPSIVRVGEQVTLSCQLTDHVPSNMSVFWYKRKEGKDAPLCSSSSLGGVVEQHQNEEGRRFAGHWVRRALLLVIRQVQVADEGTYVCAVSSRDVTREVTTHLDVAAIGHKPSVHRGVQEAGTCRYTCKSKRWYPRPEVIWTNHGGDKVYVEAKTNITWSERDHFTVQSNITVPCDSVDVVCVVQLNKYKISLSGRSRLDTCICFVEGVRPLHRCQKSWNGAGLCTSPEAPRMLQNPALREQSLLLGDGAKELQLQGGAGRGCQEVGVCAGHSHHGFVMVGALAGDNVYKAPILFVVVDIKVNATTAHPHLSIAVDKKSFTHKSQVQKATQNEESFDSSVCVLGSGGFSSGKHYWEVEVEKSNDWDLGVARKSVPRKGVLTLSPKEGFWVLGLNFKDYWARTDPWTRLTVQKHPRKVGVYLDYEEKTLTFFNITDMSVMFTFRDCSFSEEVYPFFRNSH
ncbi:BT1A1 protein, partial [Brachypteracias leptosomus]|nr:BT1A1 protein [Brachypteracias leptosomus]